MLQDLINYKKNLKKIKLLEKKIFIKNKRKIRKIRKNRVLVSLSDKDIQTIKLLKDEKESLANHVYKFYKKGLFFEKEKM